VLPALAAVAFLSSEHRVFAVQIDLKTIEALREIVGKARCLTDLEDRLVHSYDATRQSVLPDLVVKPRSVDEVSRVMKVAHERGIPVYARGAASGLTGGAVPVKGGIVVNFSEMKRIIQIDPKNSIATVEPGVVLEDFQKEVERLGLFYPPDPASSSFATIGGTVAECAGGLRCVKYGVTRDYVLGLEVVLANGDVIHTGSRTVKNVTGYDLTRLLVGSEGTLGLFTRIILRLIPLPECVVTAIALFERLASAAEAASAMMAARILPRALEIIDRTCYRTVQKFHGAGFSERADALLLIETDGTVESAKAEMSKAVCICREHGAYDIAQTDDEKEREPLWRLRENISPALYSICQKKINEDVCVPRSELPRMFARIEEMGKRHGLTIANFGHAGDGNIHVNILLEKDTTELVKKADRAVEEIFRAALQAGGTLSGEHGIGNTKSKFLSMEIQPREMSLMRELKRLFDPKNILNPGKIFV
jgi:glycolate oxidase